jgi:plastocyanin
VALAVAACASPSGAGEDPDGATHNSEQAADHGQEHGGEVPAPVDGASELAVAASSFRFDPSGLAIDAGQAVNIALTSSDVLHDFNVEDHGFHLAAAAGGTATGGLTIDEPGTYTVYCSVAGHREAGMETTLVVE